MMDPVTLIVVVLLVLALGGGVYFRPTDGANPYWGGGVIGLVLIILLILVLTGHIGHLR